MTAAVSLLLDQSNLQPFTQALNQATGGLRDARDQLDVAREAERCLQQIDAGSTPEFVRSRLELIPSISAMLRDSGWDAPPEITRELAGALAYFTDQCDLIPDSSPQFGLLDDALVIELALRRHLDEWREWQRFDAARRAQGDIAQILRREDWLSMSARQRAQLLQRPSWKRYSRAASQEAGTNRFQVH